jgi:hypothetical protein
MKKKREEEWKKKREEEWKKKREEEWKKKREEEWKREQKKNKNKKDGEGKRIPLAANLTLQPFVVLLPLNRALCQIETRVFHFLLEQGLDNAP